MFESFYKLHPTPFRLTPDPHFFFESETHKRGLAYLRFAYYQREGFVVITGAPGTGKTELSLNLIEDLPQEKVTVARIVSTNLDADDLLDLVAASFQINIEKSSKGFELKKLEDFFISQARIGKQVLLIIDEAHNLSVKSLLELSMLENFQLNEKPIMQCFLVGQLALEQKLDLPELEPLKQRIIASTRLENMDQQETRKYIIHRLSKSGWKNNPLIDDEAFFFIYQYTNGVPRKINSLCNRLLLHTFVESLHKIDANTVHEVIEEMRKERVGESLDLDFAKMQTIVERASNAQNDENKQSVLRKENKLHQITESNNKPNKRTDFDNDIEVPAFLKKAQNQSADSQLSVLEKIKEPETHESQWGDTAIAAKTQTQSRQTSNIRQQIANTTATKHVTPQIANRSSGLLDKDLQFLASLAESTALDTAIAEPVPEPEPTPPPKETLLTPVAKLPQQVKTPVRKVIVDDSVYDDQDMASSTTKKIIIDESVYADYGPDDTNIETQWLESRSTLPIKTNRRQTAMAAMAVVMLLTALSWLYLGDSEPDNVVATNQTTKNNSKEILAEGEIFAPTTPVDIELPSVGATNANAQASNETTDITTGFTTASATQKPSEMENSDTSNRSDLGELDKKIAQILDHASPMPNEVTDGARRADLVTSANDKFKSNKLDKLAALSIEKQSTDPKPAQKNLAKQSDSSTTIKHDASPAKGSTVATVKVTDPKARPAGNTKQDTVLAKSPNTSPLKKSTEHLTSGNSPSTQATNPKVTSVSMLDNGQDSVTQRSAPLISKADLSTLLFRLSDAYQTGNLQQLVSTFAPDIKSSDGSNRQQMLNEYQRLFNITDRRQLAIQDVKWSTENTQMLGEGNFEVLIREKGATKYTTYQGKISFAVAKESNGVVIKKLDYDYGQ